MLCPEAAPCVGAGARSDSPVGEARPRFVWGECRGGPAPTQTRVCSPCPRRTAGSCPGHALPWLPIVLQRAGTGPVPGDPSNAQLAEKLARTKPFPESLPSETETKVNSLGTGELGVFWVHGGSRQQSRAAAWRLQSTHPPGLQLTFSKL